MVLANPSITTTYTVTESNGGCVATTSLTVTVGNPQSVDSGTYYPTAHMLILYGPFTNPIDIIIGGTTIIPSAQNGIEAVFYGITLTDGYVVTVENAGMSGCFTTWTYHTSTTGIEEYSILSNESKDYKVTNILGQEITGPLTPFVLYIRVYKNKTRASDKFMFVN